MATVPAATATLRLTSLTSRTAGLASKAATVKLANVFSSRPAFPSLRTSRLRVCCEAKPETVDKCMEIIRKTLALPAETALKPETTFADLGADSLDTVEVVMALEETFDINVAEDSAQTIANVQDAANLIEQLVEQKNAAAV